MKNDTKHEKNTNLGHFTQVSIMTKADNESKKNEIYEYTVFTQVLRQTNKVSSKKGEGRRIKREESLN